MKFEKYIFRTSLFGWSLAKYSAGKATKIVAEHESGKIGESASFASLEEYESWMDAIVDDETAISNGAEAVNLVLKELQQPTLIGRGGPGRGQGRKPKDPLLKKTGKSIRLPQWVWNEIEKMDDNSHVVLLDAVIKQHKLKPPR